MSSRRQFRRRATLAVVAIVCCVTTVSLGVWQMRRAAEKEAVQAALDRLASQPPVNLAANLMTPEALSLHRVAVRGQYIDQYTILLDNKVLHGRVGYHVVSPLRIAGSDLYVLVNRGWLPGGRTREELPEVAALRGEQFVQGTAVVPSDRYYELASAASDGPVWQNLVLERYRVWSGLTLQPVVIQQTNDAPDNLVREWTRAGFGAERNRAYALQWFSLAGLTVIFYVVLNRRWD